MPSIDITGKTFTNLTALNASESRNGRAFWHFKCACGNTCEKRKAHVTSGVTVSCGCLSSTKTIGIRTRTHGLSNHPLYKVWSAMIERCENPNNKNFYNYGGRGISVCAEWRNDFSTYLADIGERPFKGASIDRINNNGNYEPTNIRWTTMSVQASNTRWNEYISIDGIIKTYTQWSRVLGASCSLVSGRINAGWCDQCAVTIKPREGRCRHRAKNARRGFGSRPAESIAIGNVIKTFPDWCGGCDTPTYKRAKCRIYDGWCAPCAITEPVGGSCTHS